MRFIQRLLGYFKPKQKPRDLPDYINALEAIKELLKPSSMTPVSEVLLALYNFQTELPYSFKEDFNTLSGKQIKVNSKTSQRLAQLVIECFENPHERIGSYYDVFGTGRETKPVLDWYANEESITEIVEHMAVWFQLGMRVHYERNEEGPTGDYDMPVTSHQRNFVFSSMFMKVLSDYISLLELILHCQPRGDDFEKANQTHQANVPTT
ncbi:hypothetical protein [Vibrio phage phiKT1028]|nr:hypothetical protein [Vibrio phage phiKT1028]